MEISRSIFGLAKSNNGFFKSEKQAAFLISKMSEFGGCIGHANSVYNSCPIFASWDERGITKIVKSTKNGGVIMFERKQEGILTSLEIKEIKRLERKIKKLEKEVKERQDSFDDGSWNSSGDIITYADIERFNRFQNEKIQRINSLKEKVCQLKK